MEARRTAYRDPMEADAKPETTEPTSPRRPRRTRLIATGAVALVVADAAWLLATRNDDGDDGDVADRLTDTSAQGLVDDLGCTIVAPADHSPPAELPDPGSVDSPFDCWVGDEWLVRIYVAANASEALVRRDYFDDRYDYESLPTQSGLCESVARPVVVGGREWVGIAGDLAKAQEVVAAIGGEVDDPAPVGPIVSYSPGLPCA